MLVYIRWLPEFVKARGELSVLSHKVNVNFIFLWTDDLFWRATNTAESTPTYEGGIPSMLLRRSDRDIISEGK